MKSKHYARLVRAVMAKVSKKEYAQMCGMNTRALSVYINQEKKVKVCDDDMIDTDDPMNRLFLDRRIAKGKVRPKGEIATESNENTNTPKNIGDVPTLEDSERLLRYLDTQKREKEVEKLQIEIQKKRGEVIPSELIPPIFLQHNQSILTAMKNEFDEWLRNHAKKYSIGINEVADARREATEWLNHAMNKAIDLSIVAVDAIVREYSEKRGVGERI